MATFSPPPPVQRRTRFFSKNSLFGVVDLSSAAHRLKLRQNFKASDALRIELGLDFDIARNLTTPWAGIRLLLDGTRNDSWAVEVSSDLAVVCTPRVDLLGFTNRISLPIDARVGKDFLEDGTTKPHVEVGVHNPVVAVGLLAAALVTRQPINVRRKETGALLFGVPIRFKNGHSVPHTLQARGEVDATLQRSEGLNIKMSVHQLNGVLRLRQDD